MVNVHWEESNLFTRTRIETNIRNYSSIVLEHDCIIWKGTTSGDSSIPSMGWGFKRVTYRVNICRYVLEKKLGRNLKLDYKTLHTCDNIHGPCVNEDHLYEGTSKQNSLDMVNRNRVAHGSRQGSSKLTEFQVIEIHNLLKKGVSPTILAKKYNIARETINDIKFRRQWVKLLWSIDNALLGRCS